MSEWVFQGTRQGIGKPYCWSFIEQRYGTLTTVNQILAEVWMYLVVSRQIYSRKCWYWVLISKDFGESLLQLPSVLGLLLLMPCQSGLSNNTYSQKNGGVYQSYEHCTKRMVESGLCLAKWMTVILRYYLGPQGLGLIHLCNRHLTNDILTRIYYDSIFGRPSEVLCRFFVFLIVILKHQSIMWLPISLFLERAGNYSPNFLSFWGSTIMICFCNTRT